MQIFRFQKACAEAHSREMTPDNAKSRKSLYGKHSTISLMSSSASFKNGFSVDWYMDVTEVTAVS